MVRVVCPSCRAKYRFDESRLEGKPSVRAKCQKCGGPIEIRASDSDSFAGLVEKPAEAKPAGAKTPGRTTARVRRMRSDIDDRTVNPA
ncbi:MAG: zinc-ribbon domain-containing protein, partial [Vicinamibacteria bacterium]